MSGSRGIARAGLVVSSAFLVSRVLGWVRLVVIANAFGLSAELDAFYAAFRIPDLMYQLVAAGALSSALIPVIAQIRATDSMDRVWRVVSTVVTLMTVALGVMAAVLFVAADSLVPAFVTPGFDAATSARTVELTRVMLLGPIFLAAGSAATSVLNAHGRFAAAALAPIVYNLAIIGAALVLAPSMGAMGLAIGVVAGSIAHLAVQLPQLRGLGARFSPRIDTADPMARQAVRLMAPRAIGLGASQITFVVVTALATTQGVGAVSAFTIAFSLLQIPVGIIGVPLGVVLFPSLARDAAEGDETAYQGLLGRALRAIVIVMLPTAVVSAILRDEIVAVVFAPSSIDAAGAASIASTFLVLLAGIVAHALIAVLARAFYARHDTVTPVVMAIVAVAVNTTLAFALVGSQGLPGIAAAIAVGAWVEALGLLVLLHRRLHGWDLRPLASVTGRAIVAAAVGAAAGIVVRSVLDGTGPGGTGLGATIWLVVEIGLVTAAVGAAYAAAALVLRIDDLRSIVGLMVAAIRRPRAT